MQHETLYKVYGEFTMQDDGKIGAGKTRAAPFSC